MKVRGAALAALCWSCALCSSCGYRPVHGSSGPEAFAVVLASQSVPDAVASDEVLAGVRDELARHGALASGSGYPRCEIEILRADEASEGIEAIGNGPNGDGTLVPQSRATRVAVVARAWIARDALAPHERDTGDVRVAHVARTAPSARAATFSYADALRAAARRVGRSLGARVLGFPAATEQ